MITYLQGITQQRSSWVLLLVSALFLELSAMVFQHALGLSGNPPEKPGCS